ncbi:MAG: hypothetical protein VYA80_06920, partial [Pseudomonadota bacterium]|nr:hypothetical protein [Pseudomonadota bacterium]
LYFNGHGVAIDNVTAYRLWLMASMQGDNNANANLSMLREKLTSEEADIAQNDAVEWFNLLQS